VGDEAASQIGKNKEYWVGATAYTPKTTMFLTGRPLLRLLKDRAFRPLRRATKGAAFGIRKFFEKNLTKNF